jgi:hypothetical protein
MTYFVRSGVAVVENLYEEFPLCSYFITELTILIKNCIMKRDELVTWKYSAYPG